MIFKGVEVPENSLVVREAIGDSDNDTLMCVTDYTPCCNTDIISGWYWDFQDEVIPTSNNGITMSRGNQVVRLHRPGNPGAEGIFRCRIQDTSSTFRELYVGVYGDELNNNGESYFLVFKNTFRDLHGGIYGSDDPESVEMAGVLK